MVHQTVCRQASLGRNRQLLIDDHPHTRHDLDVSSRSETEGSVGRELAQNDFEWPPRAPNGGDDPHDRLTPDTALGSRLTARNASARTASRYTRDVIGPKLSSISLPGGANDSRQTLSIHLSGLHLVRVPYLEMSQVPPAPAMGKSLLKGVMEAMASM